MEHTERRTHKRFSVDLQATICTTDDAGEIRFTEETIIANISPGGAFIHTTRDLPLGGKVLIEFQLSFEYLEKLRFILSAESLLACRNRQVKVKASGVVIREEKNGCAVIFDTDYQIHPLQPSNS